MKKKLIVLVALILLVGAGVTAALVLPTHLARAAWEEVSGKLADRLGRAVSAGNVTFSLTGPLRIDDITFAGHEGAPPLLTVAGIEVDLDVWSLVFGPIDVRRIRVEEPRIHLRLGADGLPELGDLPERLAALLRSETAGGEAGAGARRFTSRVPELRVSGGNVRLDGPGLAAYAAAIPYGRLPADGLDCQDAELTARNTSLLAEKPVIEVEAYCTAAAIGRRLALRARYDVTARDFELRLSGSEPFGYPLGSRHLSVQGLRWTGGASVTLEHVVLSQPGEESARPFVRIRGVEISLDQAPPEGAAGGPFMALAARIGRVDLDEPEIFFARKAEAGTPIDDLEEQLYIDELDARLGEEAEDAEKTPEPPPEPSDRGRRRRIKPNGEKLRAVIGRSFAKLESAFAGVTDFVHRFGSRLPVREVHVRRGRFLFLDDAAAESGAAGGVAAKLYNFHLDVERRMDEQVFAFRIHFETPDSDGERNRIEGKVHLETRDLQVRVRITSLDLDRYRPLLPAHLRIEPDSTIHDTDLSLLYSSELARVRVEGSVFFRNIELALPQLAAEPIRDLALGLELGLTLDFGQHTLELEPTRIHLNDFRFVASARVEDYARAPLVSATFELPRTDAMHLVRSVPRALASSLQGVTMTGSLALKAELSLDTADLNSLRYEIVPAPEGLRVTSMGDRVDLEAIQGRFTHRVLERDGTETSFEVGPGARSWTPLVRVSRYVIEALTTTEDGRFFFHDGFSPTQIRRSIIANLERGYFYRGASTITQQLVKNLFLTRRKTIARKLQEAFITWQMERRLKKEQILELYLNIIEWGPALYGIRAAADHYFGKKPDELTLLDTAFLVSIIPNPRRFYSEFEGGTVTPRWQSRLRRIVEAMAARGKVSEAEARAAAPYRPYFKGQTPPALPRGSNDNRREPGARVAPPAPPDNPEDDIPLPPGH